MAATRIRTLREIFRPRLVKIGSAAVGTLFVWDAASNQLGLPKIQTLWGMSGSLLPWWGWLVLLQAIFVYALFEYVRRNVGDAAPISGPPQDLDAKVREIETGLKAMRQELAGVSNAVNRWLEREKAELTLKKIAPMRARLKTVLEMPPPPKRSPNQIRRVDYSEFMSNIRKGR